MDMKPPIPIKGAGSTLPPAQQGLGQQVLQLRPSSAAIEESRIEILKALRQIRPAFAREIEEADAVDQIQLSEKEDELRIQLQAINQEWDQAIQGYNVAICELADDPSKVERLVALREAQALDDPVRRGVELRSFAPEFADLEEKLDDVMSRRSALSSQLQLVQEQKEAPLFARMMCAADLIKHGTHALAAEILLDLIHIAADDTRMPSGKGKNPARWFLHKIAAAHRLKWLDELIDVKPPDVASYRKLRAAMLMAAIIQTSGANSSD